MESTFEYILLSAYKEQMIEYLETNPDEFDEALSLALSDRQPFAWRSAWLLSGCIQNNDKRVKPYLDDIIGVLPEKQYNQQRELLKVIDKMELEPEQEEAVYYHCIKLWKDVNLKPGVRFMAFRMMYKHIQKHPEKVFELYEYTSSSYFNTLSPGIKHSLKKMMKNLKPPKV